MSASQVRSIRLLWAATSLAAAAFLGGCASAPPAPPPGAAQVWGEVAAAPPAGAHSGGGLAAYEDGSAGGKAVPAGVTLVDYAHPGVVVIELRGTPPAPGGTLELVAGAAGISPRFAAVGANGMLAIANRTGAALTFAILRDGELVAELAVAAGATSAPQALGGVAGIVDVSCYEREEPEYAAQVVAAGGPYAVRAPGESRYLIDALAPGRYELVAHHPRFPEIRRAVELAADQQLRVDLELGLTGLPRVPAAR